SLGGLKAEFAENAAKKRANYELLQNNENWLEGLKTEITKLRDELYGLENHENSLKGDIRLSQERINNYQQRLKSAKLDEGKYKEMLVKISSEVKAREADAYTQKLSYHHKLVELTLYENYLARLQEELSLLNAQFELDKANIFTHIEDEANLKNTINEKEGLLNRLREKNTRLTIKNQELTKTINYNQSALSKLEHDIDGLSADIKELSLVLGNLLKQKDITLQKLRKLEEININLENELRGINNRLITIKDNEEKLVGYSPAVKKVLSLQNEIPGIMGVIGELITVPIGLETAIETIAGRGLENIVVTSSEDAKKVIEYLKANKAGRLTLLPLDLLRVNKVTNIAINQVKQEKGVLGVAAELISCEEAYRKPIDYIFARSLVVENIEVSIRLFDKYQLPYNLVTLAGEVLNSRGAMTGGSSSNKMNYSPLKRRSEERNLIQQKAELNAQLQLNLTNLTNLKIDLAESEQEINNIKNTYNEKELHLKLATKQKDLIKEEVSHTLLNKNNAISELGDINNNITSLNAELSQLENDLENIAKTSTSYTNQLESLRLRIDEKQKDYEIGQARLPSYYEYLLAKEEELIKIKNNLEQFLNVKDSYYDSWQNAILISSKLVTDINLEMEKTKQLALQSQSNADELAVIKNKLDLKKTSISVEEAKIKNLKEILKPLNEHIIKLESSIHNDELQLARLETQLVNLKEKYQTITKQELPDNTDITYTTSEIRQFRAELAKLVEELALIGTVDLDSITEYKEITDRVDFLLKQLGDIKMGKEALEELL
ncbi:MAG: hypothetical protein GX333_06470, partial [Syntrophomonadaceae bacterium]|nr:hypothetical protein [Syntrophomonadaceae bacterium]